MWEKMGRIYCPSQEHEWEKDTFTTPHPLLIDDNVIRIYGGVRDGEGRSRIKYIDVSAGNPKEILYISDKPCLELGQPGCFDDNGMILGDIIKVEQQIYMYYVGFQHVQNVKFFAFSGLAVSDDGGSSFERVQEVPVMDRTSQGRYGRCIHTVLHEDGRFKIYYTKINDWKKIGGIYYPKYEIWYTESADGIQIPRDDNVLCIDVNEDEYRIGRPKVYKTDFGYEMYYTRDFVSKEYVSGYAVSEDGIHWERRDYENRLDKSKEGWDSQMACYAAKLDVKDKSYLFYNGNGIGTTGVGYARLS